MINAPLKKINDGIQEIEERIRHFQFLTGNSVKLIAVLAMFIDHACKIVLQWISFVMKQNGEISLEQFQRIDDFIRFDLQSIGTIAFPLFCFLLAEGFQYTGNRKRYLGRMLVFALISEIPFDIGFFSVYSLREGTFPFYFEYQNVFFTLFLGLLTLICLEKFSCSQKVKIDKIESVSFQIISVVAFAVLAEMIRCDFGMQGILFIATFYFCRNYRIYQVLLFLLLYIEATGIQPSACTILVCLIILLYNGRRGKLRLKYFFYIFYPVHISFLYFLQTALAKFIL